MAVVILFEVCRAQFGSPFSGRHVAPRPSIESDLSPTERAVVVVEALSYYQDEGISGDLSRLNNIQSTDRKKFRNGS
jgi:hypothetical protein